MIHTNSNFLEALSKRELTSKFLKSLTNKELTDLYNDSLLVLEDSKEKLSSKFMSDDKYTKFRGIFSRSELRIPADIEEGYDHMHTAKVITTLLFLPSPLIGGLVYFNTSDFYLSLTLFAVLISIWIIYLMLCKPFYRLKMTKIAIKDYNDLKETSIKSKELLDNISIEIENRKNKSADEDFSSF